MSMVVLIEGLLACVRDLKARMRKRKRVSSKGRNHKIYYNVEGKKGMELEIE